MHTMISRQRVHMHYNALYCIAVSNINLARNHRWALLPWNEVEYAQAVSLLDP
jgi:hypothetical protein